MAQEHQHPVSKEAQARSIDALTQRNVETIAKMEKAAHQERTYGQMIADRFAATIGSWTFIIIQSILLGVWVILNVTQAMYHWDPYPFTLLNLALSFEAAFASPIIMMSQNRQGRLAELRNHLDLQINLLSEQENTETLRLLRQIGEKIGVELDQPLEAALEQRTKPDKILKDIEQSGIRP